MTGVVSNASGAPVADALITPRGLDGQLVPEMAVMSGPDGRYTWTLAPGRYEFTASKDNVTSAPVTVTAPATADLRLG